MAHPLKLAPFPNQRDLSGTSTSPFRSIEIYHCCPVTEIYPCSCATERLHHPFSEETPESPRSAAVPPGVRENPMGTHQTRTASVPKRLPRETPPANAFPQTLHVCHICLTRSVGDPDGAAAADFGAAAAVGGAPGRAERRAAAAGGAAEKTGRCGDGDGGLVA